MTLETVQTPDVLRQIISGWRQEGLSVGFVPTMGALHDGHLSLAHLALRHADRCVVSIFVNPTQFAPHEDFDQYPRDVAGDLDKLEKAGVSFVYLPADTVIYPDGVETNIKPGDAAKGLESDFRPHFFNGVVNVVSRLFEHVQPDIAVFGEKDFQQLQVIREMVDEQDLPIQVIGAPVVRDEYGLALSSRNAYLDTEELEVARRLNVILRETAGTGDVEGAKQSLLDAGFEQVDYVAGRWDRILVAAWIGKTRLIDKEVVHIREFVQV